MPGIGSARSMSRWAAVCAGALLLSGTLVSAEAYVKILSAPNWESGGDISSYRRDTFYVSLVPRQIARSELPAHPLTGG